MSTTSTRQPLGTPDIETTRWRIDPERSIVRFRTATFWGLTTVEGRFEHYDGTLDLGHNPAIELTIEAASITTHNKLRDKHLRSPDFFDIDSHPHVRFESDNATLNGERLTVHGQLHAAGNSMLLTVDASLRRVGDELEVTAKTHADHRALGMTHSTLGMIRTPSELIVHGWLVRDAA